MLCSTHELREPLAEHVLLRSDGNDVLCLGTFLSGSDRKLDLLTVGEGFEAVALDRAEVNEYVRTVFLFDESVAFGLVEPFYGASNLCHC